MWKISWQFSVETIDHLVFILLVTVLKGASWKYDRYRADSTGVNGIVSSILRLCPAATAGSSAGARRPGAEAAVPPSKQSRRGSPHGCDSDESQQSAGRGTTWPWKRAGWASRERCRGSVSSRKRDERLGKNKLLTRIKCTERFVSWHAHNLADNVQQ